MKRKTPLRSNPEKTRAWKQRSATALRRTGAIKTRSAKRKVEEDSYSMARRTFLYAHQICPLTGERTTQIHHSAKREGGWLNLQRYWIAMSAKGHEYVEGHKNWAAAHGLMVRISETYRDHTTRLFSEGVSISDPVFYKHWDGEIIKS